MNLNKVKEMQQRHYTSTTPMDDYFCGMYNGMECAISILEDREPFYKSVETQSSRIRYIEILIAGHMEAMRPLLTELDELKKKNGEK